MDARDDDFLATPEDPAPAGRASDARGRRDLAGEPDRSRGRRRRWGRRAAAAAGTLVLVGGGASALALWAGPETATGSATAAAAQVLPALPAADGPDVLERWLDGGERDGRGEDGRGDHDRDDDDELHGTVTEAGTSSLVVTTTSGDTTVGLDATTDVIRDHEHVGADELASGQDVVVVAGPTSTAAKIIIIG